MSCRDGQKMNTDNTPPHNINPRFELVLLHPKYFLTWFGMGFIYLCKFLPYSLIMKLGSALGTLLQSISPHRKEIAQANMQLCFPNKDGAEINELVKAHFKNFGVGIFELAIAWWSSEKTIKSLKRNSQNINILSDLDKDQGALILIKHSTHVELDIRLMSLDIDLGGMYKPQSNKVMSYLMIKARNRYVNGAINNRQAKMAVDWMKGGHKFLYAADQDYGTNVSQFIPFFGVEAATVTFPEYLSKKGIKIIMANVARNQDGFDLEFHELTTYTEEGSVLKQMNSFYEEFILKSPPSFLWVHRRFKNRPQGQEPIYSDWKRRDRKREKIRNKRS
jgi:lauroyl/myristoyl acyltransferase